LLEQRFSQQRKSHQLLVPKEN